MANRDRLVEIAEGGRIPKGLTPDDVDREEYERVRFSLYMAVVAESIPRRLGKEAEAAALATDKRISRKVANAYRSQWMALHSYQYLDRCPPPPDDFSRAGRRELARRAEPGEKRTGATVNWGSWIEERRAALETRRGLVAALALSRGLLRWGTRYTMLLDREVENLDRIAGEIIALSKKLRTKDGP